VIVPRVLTPVPLSTIPDALDVAHRGLWGYSLPDPAYQLAAAQLKLEHGVRDGALHGVFNFNFGNHDATRQDLSDPSVPIFETVPEHEGNAASTATQVHHRRAYPDLDSGLRGYWQALRDGFPDAYDALVDGPEAFAAALKRERYFTADEWVYAKGLERLMAEV